MRADDDGFVNSPKKMHAYNTGRIQWICEECYEQGHRDVNYRDAVRELRIRKDRKWREK